MSLDPSKLRERLQARGYKQERKAKPGAKRPPPDPVIKRQEEQRLLYEAAMARHKARVIKAANTHAPLAKYIAVLTREAPETYLVEPGLVDLDLEHLIRGLGLPQLPYEVRFLALSETHQWLKAVHKQRTRSSDITPYARLFDSRFVDSLSEARNALNLV